MNSYIEVENYFSEVLLITKLLKKLFAYLRVGLPIPDVTAITKDLLFFNIE